MRFLARAPRVPEAVLERAGLARGERVLAHGQAADGAWLVGTRSHLLVWRDGVATRLAWSAIAAADWDQDSGRLTISELGEFGRVRPRHVFELEDQGLLLQLVRERVQASILLQRRILVRGRRGFTVIGRRRTDGQVDWLVDYDNGVEPDDPAVVALVDQTLATARDDAGTAI